MQDLERKLTALTQGLVKVILEKNAAYGNSVFDPVNIFSRGDAVSLLEQQIDHKLSRIARGKSAGEDTRKDFIAYLLLLEVAISERDAKRATSNSRKSAGRVYPGRDDDRRDRHHLRVHMSRVHRG